MVQLSDLVRVTRGQAAELAFHFEAGSQVQKGGASGDCRLRLTATMLRHKHSNSRGKGKPFTLTSVDDAD